MAVVLERESESTGNTPTKLPKVVVKNAPIQSPSILRGVITSRTSRTFTSEEQVRTSIWKENYDRRMSQLSECGFYCPPTENYRAVGNLQLDDKYLIEQGLGQKPSTTAYNISQPVQITDDVRTMPLLRARNPTLSTSEILRLHSELDRANYQLDQVRLGQGLFHMLHLQDAKMMAETNKQLKQKTDKVQDWRPASNAIETVITVEDYQKIEKDETVVTKESDTISSVNRQLSILVWILEAMMHDSTTLIPSPATYWNNKLPAINVDIARRQYDQRQKILQKWEHMQPTWQKHQLTQSRKKDEAPAHVYRNWQKVDRQRIEEELIRKQRRLSPEQFEQLKLVIEDELNYAMKQTRNNLRELIKTQAANNEGASCVELPEPGERSAGATMTLSKAMDKFKQVEEDRGLIVQEQLSVMSRDKQDALRQRFASLKISGNVWHDLAIMRKGVKMESTIMARNKLMMNYKWMSSLVKVLPKEALDNTYCYDRLQRLSKLQDYMCSVGPKVMSKNRLISVLSSLRPWELHSPEIAVAIEFIIRDVIYIVPEDYYQWLEYHTSACTAIKQH